MMMENAPNSFFSGFHPPGFYQNFGPSGNSSMVHTNPPGTGMFGGLNGNSSMLPPSGPPHSSAFSGFSPDVIGRRSFGPSSHHPHSSFSNPPPPSPFFNGWSSGSYGSSGNTFIAMQPNPPAPSSHMGLLTSSDPILIIPSNSSTTPQTPPFFSRSSKPQHTSRLTPINSPTDRNNDTHVNENNINSTNNTNNNNNNTTSDINNNNLSNHNNNNSGSESKQEISKLDEIGITIPSSSSSSSSYFQYLQKYNSSNNDNGYATNVDNNNNHQHQQHAQSACNGFSPYQSPLKTSNMTSPGTHLQGNNNNSNTNHNSSNHPLNHYNNQNNNSFTNNLLGNNNLKPTSLGYSPFSSSDILSNQTPFVSPHQHPLNQLSNLYVGDMYANHPSHHPHHHHHHLPPASGRLFSSELASLPLPSRIDPGHMGYLNDLANQTAVGW